jgi:diguanylate cyclase (GGDEF)-like protein
VLRWLDGRDRRLVVTAVREAGHHGRPVSLEVTLRVPSHTPRRLALQLSVHCEECGSVLRIVGWNVGAEAVIERRLSDVVSRDPLTGLANRKAFVDALERAVRAYAANGRPVTLMLLDLDHFRAVNDSLGHPAGDQLLIAVARRLEKIVRERELVARLGGDEFALLLQGRRGAGFVASVANRLRETVRQPHALGGTVVRIGTSIGVARLPEHARDATDLLAKADLALYQVKREGRDGFREYASDFARRQAMPFDLVSDLRGAVEQETLAVHLQPQIDVATGAYVGCEALVRWHHAQRGAIAPTEFVALAEQSSLIADLGRMVLRQSCRHWQRLAEVAPSGFTMSVNVSPAQLWHMNLVTEVAAALDMVGMPPDALVLEMTEGVFLEHDRAHVAAVLEELRRLGVQLALDDFGTGFSSLAYLSSLPFGQLKIDRRFVQGADRGRDRRALLRSMIDLGHAMHMTIVAEGVERDAEAEFLRACDCKLVQGLLFGRPMAVGDLRRTLAATQPAPAA